jgi:hypothetical protein
MSKICHQNYLVSLLILLKSTANKRHMQIIIAVKRHTIRMLDDFMRLFCSTISQDKPKNIF